METLEKVRKYVLENTFADNANIEDATLIFKEGYFDSMGFLSLLDFIETEFGIQAEDNELIEANFESINAVVKYVSDRLS